MNQKQKYFVVQQLKRHRKSIIGWSIIWTLLSLLFSTVFKSMSETAEQSARIYEALPPAVLKTVNISADYLTKPENFLSGQFLTIYLLAGSIFSVIMGVNAIGGKIQDKTILNYLSKKFSRVSIYILQALVVLLTLIIINIIVAASLYISFSLLSGAEPSPRYIVATFTGAVITFISFASVGLVAGVILEKSHATALGSALAVVSFFVNGLGALAGVPPWLKKISLYYYFDTEKLRDFYTLDSRIYVLTTITILLTVLGAYLFRKKDLYI